MKILIIDDDELMRIGLKALLERRGHEIFLYETGDGAVDYALELCPDITLTDHNLGLCATGLKIASALISEGRKAVLMSGDARVERPAWDMGVPFAIKGDPRGLIELVEERGRADDA